MMLEGTENDKYNAPYTSFTFIMIATKTVAKPIFNLTILPKIN